MKHSASNDKRRFILPRSRILRGQEPVQRLFRKGKVVRDQHLDLRYLLFPEQPGVCLMGFIAGKRLGKAHERNVIKRYMREAYRLNQHLIRDISETGQIGFHGIFIAKKVDTPFSVVEQECRRLLDTARTQMIPGGAE